MSDLSDEDILLVARLDKLIKAVGGRSAAAQIIGRTPKMISDWKSDPSKIRLTAIQKLALEAGWSIDSLLTGKVESDQLAAVHGERDLIQLPLYDVQLSAGTGSIESRVDIIDELSFSLNFLSGVGVGSTDNAGLFRVTGDSMEPSAPDNSLVIVNTMEQEIVDGIYAIAVDGQARIKRLRKRVTGELEIISDNDLYEKEVLVGEDLNLVTIIGRVRCIIKWL